MKALVWTYIVLTLEALLIVPVFWLAAVIRDVLWKWWVRC